MRSTNAQIQHAPTVNPRMDHGEIAMSETDVPYRISLGVTRAASYWYPTMLAQETGELSESKAAELLGLSIPDYREAKHRAIGAVMMLIKTLPLPLVSLVDVLKQEPDFFNKG